MASSSIFLLAIIFQEKSQANDGGSGENQEDLAVDSDEKSGTSENSSDDSVEDSGDEEEDENSNDEYVVEKILDKRYNRRKKRVEYLIKWAGYDDESENTWESAENCVTSSILSIHFLIHLRLQGNSLITSV